MSATVDEDVVVDLEAAVLARDERRRIADAAEETAEGDLRIPHVAWIGGNALQPGRAGKIEALIRADLAAAGVEIAEAELIQPA